MCERYVAYWRSVDLDIRVRLSLIFLALCSALDEISTFTHLSMGANELNPRVAWLLGINPLLYPLCDIALFLLAWFVDKQLISRKVDLWFLWMSAGVARLLCVALSLS